MDLEDHNDHEGWDARVTTGAYITATIRLCLLPQPPPQKQR
jgi:hypothetical protein